MSESTTWSQHPYRVRSSTLVTPVISELWLSPSAEPLAHRAGQYVLLGDTDWRVPQRSYSVANAPRPDGGISVLVTRVEGGPTSTWAHRLQPGDEVLLEGPYGLFTTAPDRQGPLLLLGAGSGLAPLRALAEAVLHEAPGRPVTLFFSCRSAADRIGAAEFERWQAEHPQFRYLDTLTREPTAPRHGRLPPQLAEAVGDLRGWEVFASGPSGFVVACAEAAQALGAAATDIHTEEFFTDPQPWLGDKPALPGASNPSGDPA
ncbi:MAG TPA: FAD-binding oxidoreductase [Ottowia sp.]|uniref:ferredoxin--NADP reductase n=1 Tax=Ottowia sp. TaxID=1898956 RepID=UPI002B702EC2|nr:FAD-binding oxidoreductase [Ottowia sp.]HMN20685.1 FAD-binding oxidoreductase [Ottowia sp.]